MTSWAAMFVSHITHLVASAPPATDPAAAPEEGLGASMWDVITGTVDNLGENGYQTGLAVVAATAAVIAMINIRSPRWVIPPVAVGAFWAGWLGWNTLSGQDNPLFPGNVDAVKLWDVAIGGDRGFLIVVIVACVAAIFVWRTGMGLAGRLMLMFGAVLGASFLFNLVEAVRVA